MFCERNGRSPIYIAFAFVVDARLFAPVRFGFSLQATFAVFVLMVRNARQLVCGCWFKLFTAPVAAGLARRCTAWC